MRTARSELVTGESCFGGRSSGSYKIDFIFSRTTFENVLRFFRYLSGNNGCPRMIIVWAAGDAYLIIISDKLFYPARICPEPGFMKIHLYVKSSPLQE